MKTSNPQFFALATAAIFVATLSSALAQKGDAQESLTLEGPVAIYVNDHPVYQSEVDEVLLQFIRQNSGVRRPTAAMIELARDKLEPEIINTLVDEYLLESAFEKLGLSVSQEEYLRYIEIGLDNSLHKMDLTRKEYARRMLETRGVSLDDIIRLQSQEPKYRQSVRVIKILEKRYPKDMKITDKEVRKQYEARKRRDYVKPAQVRASHILIGTKNLTTDEEKRQAKKKAQQIALEVKKEGADFAALAATNSTGPRADRGGDVGFFPRDGAMAEPFAAAAFALKVGQVSDVIETRHGYHIIKLTGRNEERIIPLEAVADWIRYEIQGSHVESLSGAYVSELRAKADVRFP